MTIVQLGPYPPPYGGVQANLVAIRRCLLRREVRSAVINLTRHREAQEDGIYHPATAWETAWLLWRLPYRILHFHWGGNVTLRLLGLSLFLCWLPGRKAVLTFHSGGYPGSRQGRAARAWTFPGFVFRQFDRIIAVNEEIAAMMRRYGVRDNRLRVICPTAIDPSEIAAALPDPLRRFYEEHHPVLLTVGLLEREYDLRLQIDVLGQVRTRLPNAGLAIVGSGSLESELKQQIQSKAWAEHILLTGDVPRGVSLKAIQEADIFLRTTWYDGDAVSVREALHFGTPVIATDNGMRPPGLRLIPVGDAAALESAIVEPAQRQRPPADAGFSGVENIDAVLELYRELDPE